MKELIALAVYIFLGMIACMAYVAYGAQPQTKADKPALPKTCRFLICPKSAKQISDCPTTVTHDGASTEKAFKAMATETGFYDCGGTESEFDIKRVIFEAMIFGGGK